MKSWQATLVLIVGLFAGVALWFGFGWLGTHAPAPAKIAAADIKPLSPPVQEAAPSSPPSSPDATFPTGVTGSIAPAPPAADDVPPHVFAITQRGGELGSLLESAPFVSENRPGSALYFVTFRACPACLALKEGQMPAFRSAGVDVRWLVYARRDQTGQARSTPEERAMVAELARTRDAAELDAWLKGDPALSQATPPPAVETSPERTAAIEAGRARIDQLAAILAANGEQLAMPALFWKVADQWYGYVGYDEASFAMVRRAFGLPVLTQQ